MRKTLIGLFSQVRTEQSILLELNRPRQQKAYAFNFYPSLTQKARKLIKAFQECTRNHLLCFTRAMIWLIGKGIRFTVVE